MQIDRVPAWTLLQRLCVCVVSLVLQDTILPLLIDVSSGMEYIHSKGVVHGDIKPENSKCVRHMATECVCVWV